MFEYYTDGVTYPWYELMYFQIFEKSAHQVNSDNEYHEKLTILIYVIAGMLGCILICCCYCCCKRCFCNKKSQVATN